MDIDSLKTLVHAFIMSRLDYCNAVISPGHLSTGLSDVLQQRVLNAAARLVTSSHKYNHGLSQLLHDELHWLDVPDRVQYKLAVTVLQCLQNRAPKYLVD